MINVTINGDTHSMDEALPLIDLLGKFEIDHEKVAIEHNREIVPKTTFADVTVGDGDNLEIVHFIGGG
ncbi:sulfur carrier protein ThiS [Pseudemcibacter aquimaris]|uniref:sulfur carrier protein ThiS n=1 Tax=Pseudemcibacter aquimaris TaxID=2857064 RepID=UPI0020114621|nr:sulfur carrier protein ThiS [Pseudemcibacter aquimaris]MCC3860092.1 sulfur carrier protein ThiS [Pseudemcibacter aquimaris]WDU57421.1 sulfur carrier protein ThiS [Pseudemcibacter aquimaris]